MHVYEVLIGDLEILHVIQFDIKQSSDIAVIYILHV